MRQIGWWQKEDIEQAKGMVAKGGHRAGNQRVRQIGWWQKEDIEQATRECGKLGGGTRRT